MSGKLVAIIVGAFLVAGYAQAGPDQALLCKEKKAKATGKKAADLLKAFGKNIKKENAAKLGSDISKAQSKFTKGFTKAEAGGQCLTSGDSDPIEAKVDRVVCQIVDSIGPATCGNNCAGVGEECDEGVSNGTPDSCCEVDCTLKQASAACSDTDGNECTTAGCDGVSGACDQNHVLVPDSTPCTETDGDECTTAGCDGTGTCDQAHITVPEHFIDNGNGTISDCWTGLMWEKKDEAGGIHNVDNRYSWAGCCDGSCSTYDDFCQPNAAAAAACSTQTGGAVGCGECSVGTCDVDPYGWDGGAIITTIWDWLATDVNQPQGFARYTDWRIPEVNQNGGAEELETILLEPYPCGTIPCIDPIFGPTGAEGSYWSSTTYAFYPRYAWVVHFGDGDVDGSGRNGDLHVRAVRGGSVTPPSSTTTVTLSSTTTSTLTQRFVDKGDGTITDNQTGLMWEKKDDAGGIHDMHNWYMWSISSPWIPDGTAFTWFLDTLNNRCDGDESTSCTTDGDCTGIGNALCGHAVSLQESPSASESLNLGRR